MKRSDLDLGDRYRNSLSYLTRGTAAEAALKPSTYQTQHPAVDVVDCSVKSDNLQDEEQIRTELESMVSTLHIAINQDFANKTGVWDEELFHLPEDFKAFSILEKTQLARDLVEKLCQGRASLYSQSPTTKSAKIIMQPTGDGLVSKLLQSNDKGLQLTTEDCQHLGAVLLGAVRDSASSDLLSTLKLLQENYLKATDKLSDTRRALRKKEDELEHLVDSNSSLRNSLKILKQQTRSLERQLTDALEEAHNAEENYLACRSELHQVQFGSLTSPRVEPTRSQRESGRDSNVRFIFNGLEGEPEHKANGLVIYRKSLGTALQS
jgi:hypothetical protein